MSKNVKVCNLESEQITIRVDVSRKDLLFSPLLNYFFLPPLECKYYEVEFKPVSAEIVLKFESGRHKEIVGIVLTERYSLLKEFLVLIENRILRPIDSIISRKIYLYLSPKIKLSAWNSTGIYLRSSIEQKVNIMPFVFLVLFIIFLYTWVYVKNKTKSSMLGFMLGLLLCTIILSIILNLR